MADDSLHEVNAMHNDSLHEVNATHNDSLHKFELHDQKIFFSYGKEPTLKEYFIYVPKKKLNYRWFKTPYFICLFWHDESKMIISCRVIEIDNKFITLNTLDLDGQFIRIDYKTSTFKLMTTAFYTNKVKKFTIYKLCEFLFGWWSIDPLWQINQYLKTIVNTTGFSLLFRYPDVKKNVTASNLRDIYCFKVVFCNQKKPTFSSKEMSIILSFL